MTTAGLEPQIVYRRELILIGELEQFKALMELEASLCYDLTFRDFGRTCLCLLGPIAHGASLCWLVHSDRQPILSPEQKRTDQITISWGGGHVSVSPDMTLQQIYDRAVEEHLDLCRALRLGMLRASPLPHGRLRLLFAVAGYDHPPLFWGWVDGLTAELHRLGFRAAAPLAVPSPLAGEAAGEAQPWLQVPDYLWDRQALELWWNGLTMPEIAARLGYTEKTIRNRFSTLRAIHGTDTVPTADRLRKLRVR